MKREALKHEARRDGKEPIGVVDAGINIISEIELFFKSGIHKSFFVRKGFLRAGYILATYPIKS